MNVLYIISSTVFGGATLSFLALIQNLIPLGIKPIVAIPNRDAKLESELQKLNIKYYIIPIIFCCYPNIYNWKTIVKYPFLLLKMILLNILSISKLVKIAKKEHVSLIHTNVGPVYAGHFAAKQCQIPHVWHIREYGDLDFQIKSFPSKKFFHKILSKDVSICITHDLQHYNNLDNNKKSFVVYNGVCKKTNSAITIPKEKFFLCASRISPEKGIHTAIQSFIKFSKDFPDYKLIILGSGDECYTNKQKEFVHNNNFDNKILFEGFKQDVFSYMKRATALIVASPSEGFGRMTAEACIAGCLVIGKASAGTKEILDQTGGLEFDEDSELVYQMKKVAQMENAEYLKISQKAQLVANEKFTEEAYIQNIWNIYNYIWRIQP